MRKNTKQIEQQSARKQDEESFVSDNRKSERSIQFFSSFQEMEEDKIKKMASRTPEERIRNVTHLLKMVYHDSLKTPSIDRTIKFES